MTTKFQTWGTCNCGQLYFESNFTNTHQVIEHTFLTDVMNCWLQMVEHSGESKAEVLCPDIQHQNIILV